MTEKGVVMGVDYGDARTGIAVTDAGAKYAFGACCVRAKGMRTAARLVAEEAKKRRAVRIVVGLPLNMDGTEGARAEKARAFAQMIEELTSLPVEMWDERLTTVEAYGIMDEVGVPSPRRREKIDTLSAEVILQSYIDAKR